MPKGKGRQDPLGNYIEWANHRYDPGHYLGGTIEPHLRKSSLGPNARRLSGIMLLVSGVPALTLAGLLASDGSARALPYVGIAALFIAAGVSMRQSARPRRGGSKTRRK